MLNKQHHAHQITIIFFESSVSLKRSLSKLHCGLLEKLLDRFEPQARPLLATFLDDFTGGAAANTHQKKNQSKSYFVYE